MVTASVYYGTWEGERDETANPLITRLSDPFPDRDYLCIVTACYTLVFDYLSEAPPMAAARRLDGHASDGLSFTIASVNWL